MMLSDTSALLIIVYNVVEGNAHFFSLIQWICLNIRRLNICKCMRIAWFLKLRGEERNVNEKIQENLKLKG